MSDELERRLRDARPATAADDGWSASAAGVERLAAVRAAVAADGADRTRMRVLLHRPPVARGAALTVLVAAAVVALLIGVFNGATPVRPPLTGPGEPAATPPMALTAFADCAALRRALRVHARRHLRRFLSLAGSQPMLDRLGTDLSPLSAPVVRGAFPAAAPSAQAATTATPAHSGTNDQVHGVDEPDIVKTDGTRIVTITDGVLRVVDVATRTVTGQLSLRRFSGGDAAQLLLAGDRALVIVPPPLVILRGGPAVLGPVAPRPFVPDVPARPTTLLLVDLTAAPRILATAQLQGSYVNARLVNGVVRVVVDSTPRLSFPVPVAGPGNEAANQRVIEHAPLADWLPRYDVSPAGGAAVQHRVACTDVEHPIRYSGTSMVTVFSVDMAAGLADLAPISLATDAATVYGTGHDLYIAATPRYGQPEARTQIHRFDITRPGRPTYLGSATVSGQLLDSYAMDADGRDLRVVTTVPAHADEPATTRVSVVDTDSLRVVGILDGLGRGQQVEAVRFAGPTAYVVTYRSLDPLYVLDLADPTAPREAGELHVTGYSDYLHPVAAGRLLGVGRTVAGREPDGVQLSLFDVSEPATPRRLARIARQGAPDAAGADSHAFLYWAPTGTAVVPLQGWGGADSGAALVVRVSRSSLAVQGVLRQGRGGGGQVERSLVVGSTLWTLSPRGLHGYDLHSLAARGTVRFG